MSLHSKQMGEYTSVLQNMLDSCHHFQILLAFSLQSWSKYLEQRKEIKQNWTGAEKFCKTASA